MADAGMDYINRWVAVLPASQEVGPSSNFVKHLYGCFSMRWPRFLFPVLALFGCSPNFVDTTTPGGVPNLVEFAPKMWRMGQPPDAAAWKELAGRIAPNGEKVVVVKLNDDNEGSDDPATALGWTVLKFAMPPEDDKPWTIVVKPDVNLVTGAVAAILQAHMQGFVVVWHCSHGRDRTGLVSALVGKAMFGWTKDQMSANMTEHGFRWIDVDLSEYFLLDATKAPAQK
jgi:protein-tyrosine phosphatase family protein